MKIAPFQTEHFFAKYEFNTPYQLCNSDCETVTVGELLAMAGIPIERFNQISLGYTESQGAPALREQIAGIYQAVTADEIIELNAPIEGIFLFAQAALNPGDEVIVLSPAYDALINVFEHVAGKENVKKWEFIPEETQWMLDTEQLKAMITKNTRVLVVNFPHNPTGYLPTPQQWEEIIGIVELHDLLLFCDEMYTGLVNDGTLPIQSAVDMTENAIVLSGLSKTYGLPGLRSGWLVVQDEELRENCLNWKFYTTICPPAPVEFLASAALTVKDDLREHSQMQIKANIALAEAFFSRWADVFAWRYPRGGSTALVGMNVPSVTQFASRMAEEAGVLIQPANMLGTTDQYFRMGFGRVGFVEALDKFEQYLLSLEM